MNTSCSLLLAQLIFGGLVCAAWYPSHAEALWREQAKNTPSISIQFRSSVDFIQVTGRILPDWGALRVEHAPEKAVIQEWKISPGSFIQKGQTIALIRGPSCAKLCPWPAQHEGLVYELFQKVGETVDQGEALFSLADPKATRIRIDVPEKWIPFLHRGQELKVQVYEKSISGPALPLRATVSEVLPPLGSGELTRGIYLRPLKSKHPILTYRVVTAQIPVSRRPQVIRVPPNAVAYHQGRYYVLKK
jgi:multidrug efflux pump subunit AcrA (membrane-fusion protein)